LSDAKRYLSLLCEELVDSDRLTLSIEELDEMISSFRNMVEHGVHLTVERLLEILLPGEELDCEDKLDHCYALIVLLAISLQRAVTG
jgi:hypothetical protein